MTPAHEPDVRVAVLQATGLVGSPAENLRRIAARAQEARQRGAELLVTPELFTSGYAPTAVHGTDGTAQREQLAAIAVEHGIALAASTVEHEDGRRYISASLFGPDGTELARYRKQNLFGTDENSVFTPGSEAPAVVDFKGVKIALGICFDVEFPEFVRSTALAGAELLCVPTAVPLRAGDDAGEQPFDTRLIPSMVVPTRALESQIFIAYANHAGPDFAGLSTVADPYGRRLATASGEGELILADVDLAVLAQARRDTDYLARFMTNEPTATNH
ncbi:nitrilase-related carbon-nitrogen hydrolase [Arthrobacter sp. MMS18-M83]|uniref:nitrilase-related carbon-nitrogen hydrolase n=1 Tax=Arthrobacter sp. MMS18-M83 TaxID=2996261 RepID=UPI00227A7D01|nr:nitrilase-related carbon-nitrogen hydrolase [Arthrobacter sp. MMS18-M83]WAH97091.1 carbon-nitrogen hydrolase [Arthrobacter sp. MMS18-M83]